MQVSVLNFNKVKMYLNCEILFEKFRTLLIQVTLNINSIINENN